MEVVAVAGGANGEAGPRLSPTREQVTSGQHGCELSVGVGRHQLADDLDAVGGGAENVVILRSVHGHLGSSPGVPQNSNARLSAWEILWHERDLLNEQPKQLFAVRLRGGGGPPYGGYVLRQTQDSPSILCRQGQPRLAALLVVAGLYVGELAELLFPPAFQRAPDEAVLGLDEVELPLGTPGVLPRTLLGEVATDARLRLRRLATDAAPRVKGRGCHR